MLSPHSDRAVFELEQGNDMPTLLFRTGAGLLTAPMARDIAARAGNRIGHYALHFGAWDQGEQLARDGQAFVDCIRPFCNPTTEVGSRAVALCMTVWRPVVAELGGASSAVTMTLMRDELGRRELEFARAVRPNAQRLASALRTDDPKALAVDDDNAIAFFAAGDQQKPKAFGQFLMGLLQSPAPHRALEDNTHFAVRPLGRALC